MLLFQPTILCVAACLVSLLSSAMNGTTEEAETLQPINGDGMQSNLLFPLPTEYKTSTFNGILYTYHYNTYQEWNEAYGFCRDTGGELASIMSQAQQNVIQKLLKKPRATEEFGLVWLGGSSRNDCVHRWKWPNVYEPIIHEVNHDINHDYLYTHWDVSEHAHEPDLECVGISNDPFWIFGRWKTDACDTQHAFICQFDRCQRLSHTTACTRTKGCSIEPGTGGCRTTARPVNFIAPSAKL
jgi:hypothetical protein